MKKLLKIFLPHLLALCPWVLLGLGISQAMRCTCRRPPDNDLPTTATVQPMQRDTIHDTVEVIKQPVYIVEKVKEVLASEDKELLKDMGVRLSAVESYQKISTETEATVTLKPDTSIDAEEKGSSRHQDSILTYHDAWTDLKYNNVDKSLHFRFRDSLAIALEKEYRHRFLWWRWKVMGYRISIANFNPHSRVTYNSYLKAKK